MCMWQNNVRNYETIGVFSDYVDAAGPCNAFTLNEIHIRVRHGLAYHVYLSNDFSTKKPCRELCLTCVHVNAVLGHPYFWRHSTGAEPLDSGFCT